MRPSLQRGFIRSALLILALGTVLFVSAYNAFVAAPSAFPAQYHLTVSSGDNVRTISEQLSSDDAIKSKRAFEILMTALGSDKSVSEGEYSFEQPTSLIGIALRLSGKEFGTMKQKVTFPEGYTNKEMAARLAAVFPDFDTAGFLALAAKDQGMLFPDTYSFFPTPRPETVVTAMKNNYEKKILPIRPEIQATGRSEQSIIIMASIIEKEAKGVEDSPVIAGILWKRLQQGMLLQVDAAPVTYAKKGLPADPIGNPGLRAITAVLYPTSSSFVYYLHDRTGAIHYASTYAQHAQNIKKYLQ
ncbi:MAG: endolytic transglycosylase MltG [Patescibacteria group bacterium]